MSLSDESSESFSSRTCGLCQQWVSADETAFWKEVTGWVGGPKKDSMRLRQDTGRIAHNECVRRMSEGQAPDQPDMFNEEVTHDKPHFSAEIPDTLRGERTERWSGPV